MVGEGLGDGVADDAGCADDGAVLAGERCESHCSYVIPESWIKLSRESVFSL